MPKALNGKDAEDYAYQLAAALMAGQKPPEIEYDYLDAEAFRHGTARYMTDLQRRMRELPAKISDDPAVQAMAREEFAKVFAQAEILIADGMFDLHEKSVPRSTVEE